MAIAIATPPNTDCLNTSGQKKIARDSSGYYYVAYADDTPGNDEIFLIKSATTTGFNGTETPVEIVGSAGKALSGDNGDSPSIVIDGNDILKMVFRRLNENETWYAQWDTSTDMTDSNNWTHADGSTQGAERLCTDNFGDALSPNIAVDSNNYPHIIWRQDDGGVYELFYRRWTGASWSTADTQITDNSVNDNRQNDIAIDENDHVHIVWMYIEADVSIRYAHTEDFTNWYQSDDVTPITNGASGEEIIDQAGKDISHPAIAISKYASTLNDIWVVAYDNTDKDIMYAWYDKSAGSWTVDQDLETAGSCERVNLGIDGRGFIYVIYSKDDNIRRAKSTDSGTSWHKSTLNTSANIYKPPNMERSFNEDDYFGYVFFDDTANIIYFDRESTKWYRKKYPHVERNQPYCMEDLGYIFQDSDEDIGYSDKETQSEKINLLQTPMVERNGTANKLGYIWSNNCEDKELFDVMEIETFVGGGGTPMIWLNLPGK